MKYNEQVFLDKYKKGELIVTPKGEVFSKKSKPMGRTTTKGYKATAIRVDKKIVHILVHRLVYMIHKQEDLGELTINHINGNKVDNSIDNLELITMKDNIKHARANNLCPPVSMEKRRLLSMQRTGEKTKGAKLKNSDAKIVRSLYSNGATLRELGIKYGVAHSTIYKIVSNKRYKEI